MANVTTAAGGGTVVNGVVVYLPECSSMSYGDVNYKNAMDFDITDTAYLVRLLPSIVPGVLFGILSLFGFIFFSVWLCAQCGRRRRDLRSPAPEQAQFITSQQLQSAPPPSSFAASNPLRTRRGRAAAACKALLLALALALAGVSAWGLAASINATNQTFTDLWNIVGLVNGKVVNATNDLDTLGGQLGELSGNISAVTDKAPELLTVFDTVVGLLNITDVNSVLATSQQDLTGTAAAFNTSRAPSFDGAAAAALNSTLGVVAGANTSALREELAGAVDALVALPSTVDGIQAAIASGADLLRDNFNETLHKIQASYKVPTLAVEDRWRFIPIAVVFGTTIAASLLVALTFWSLRWYRSATAALVLLWLDIALLMLLGVGLLRAVNVVTSDSCLYGEFLSLQLASRKVAASHREQVLNIFSYYYGLISIPDALVVDQLLGVPTYQLHEFVYGPILPVANKIVELGNVPQVQTLLAQAGLEGEGISALQNLTQLLPAVSQTVSRLESQALAPSIAPLYRQIKSYLCCALSGSTSEIWIAWTCAGTLGFALAVLCTGRIAAHTLNLRRFQRQLAAAAADDPCAKGGAAPAGRPGKAVASGSSGSVDLEGMEEVPLSSVELVAAPPPQYWQPGAAGGGARANP